MKRIMVFVFIVTSGQLFVNCYYDNEVSLYGTEQCSTDSVTYSGTIAPIIQSNCISCHSQAVNSGGVTLETYAQVKARAGEGVLLGVVTHSSGFSPMPKNSPKLSDCNIAAIRQWIEEGALNQ
jgi:mono/diheme cytochrome c family protein